MIYVTRSEVFTAAKIHIVPFWLLLDGQRYLGGTYCLHCQGTSEDEAGCSLRPCYPPVTLHSVITQKTTYGHDVNSLNTLQPFIELSRIHFTRPTTGTYKYTYMTSVHSYMF